MFHLKAKYFEKQTKSMKKQNKPNVKHMQQRYNRRHTNLGGRYHSLKAASASIYD